MTRTVKVGNKVLGGGNPVLIQSMLSCGRPFRICRRSG